MGVSVYWDDAEQTVMCLSFVGAWTWDEFDAEITKLYITVRSVSHPVHILVDIRYTAPQTSGPAWKSLSRALRMLPENTGLVLLCGVGYFTAAFFIQLAGMFPKMSSRLKQITTLSEAYPLIEAWAAAHNQRPPASAATASTHR
jgi:hypothetical protein